MDNSGKGVKWDYLGAADLRGNERALPELNVCGLEGSRRKGMDMKGKAVVLVLAGVGVVSGMTLNAGATEDLWSYDLVTDESGDEVYQFRDVELTIPADWDGKYELEVDEDANPPYGTVAVYHKASQEALSADSDEASGGYLFTLTCSTDYNFADTLPDCHIIGEADGYIYYVSLPTDVQGYTEDKEIWTEWQELYGDVDWVLDHATLLNEEEGKMAASTAVNIRSAASTSGAIMGVVPKGGIVTITGEVKNGWVPVAYNEIKGYIKQDYLVKVSGSEKVADGSANENSSENTNISDGKTAYTVSGTILSLDGETLTIRELDGSSSVWNLSTVDHSAFDDSFTEGAVVTLFYEKGTLKVLNVMVQQKANSQTDVVTDSVTGTILSLDGEMLTIREQDGSSSVWNLSTIDHSSFDQMLVEGAAITISYARADLKVMNVTVQ